MRKMEMITDEKNKNMKRIMNKKNFFASSAWRLGGAARRAATALLLCVMTTMTAWASVPQGYDYIDASGTTHNTAMDGIGENDNPTVINSTNMPTTLSGWYVVTESVTYDATVRLNGSTTIILKNGCTMSIGEDADGKRINGKGIYGPASSPLTIYGQSLDDATAGHLKIFTTGNINSYCISYSPYTQHSGNVTVKATGSKVIHSDGDITINGGTLSATSLTNEAVFTYGGDIIINGGKVNATSSTHNALWSRSGDVTINGGQVEATGNSQGIYAGNGTITLGWTNATDYIRASSYYGTVQVADGLAFLTDDATPQQVSGTVGNLSLIDGKKLSPDLAVAFTANSDGSYTIGNAYGWGLFCDRLAADDGKAFFSGKTVRLANDITVSRMAGNVNHDFTGTFDGNGHTLTFNHTAADNYCAPFRYVQGSSNTDHAIIQNLNVVSNITAADYRHPAGLIALQSGYVDVTDCNAVVNIDCTKGTNNPNDLYPAGLVSQSNNTGSLTVSGCTVSGTISTDGKYAAGMVGIVQSSASITNSVSSVTINSSTDGDGTHSGFVASLVSGRHLTIEGCVFNGKIVTTNGTTNCGGFLGHNNTSDGTGATITNCLYAPAADPNTVSTGCATFGRNVSSDLISNCYYTTALGDAQGTQAYSISKGEYVTTLEINGTATQSYDVSGLGFYSTGIKCGDVLYAVANAQLDLTLANNANPPLGYQYDYTVTGEATLNGNTLTMAHDDVTVSVDTESGLHSTGQPVSVTYMNADGTTSSHNAIALDETMTTLAGGWYFVGKDIAYTGTITLNGDVNIILADGKAMSVGTEQQRISNGRCIQSYGHNNVLIYGITIYGQSSQSGALNAYNSATNFAFLVKDFAQHGGKVTIDASNYGALALNHGDLTLTRGTLNANAASSHKAIQLHNDQTATISYKAIQLHNDQTATISGGILNANSTNGAAISGGDNTTLLIKNGAIVNASGQYGIRVNNINMTGGTVTATGTTDGIYGEVTFSGGNLTATGSTYGIHSNVTLSWTSPDDRITVSSFNSERTITIADGKHFHNGSEVLSGTVYNYNDGNPIGDLSKLNGKTLIGVDVLQDAATNDVAALATRLGGKQTNVALSGRKLWKDGAWNTLCLPFDVVVGSGQMAGATAMTLNGSTSGFNASTGVLTLNFDGVGEGSTIAAGTPFIVKWTGTDVTNPVFSGVTVSSTAAGSVLSTDGYVTFQGTYDKLEYTSEDKSILFLGDENTLYWPQPSGENIPTIGAFRAYFHVDLNGGANAVRSFVLNFGDSSESTGIREIDTDPAPSPSPTGVGRNAAWYTLDGRKLSGKPTKSGVYIHNGRKVVIK